MFTAAVFAGWGYDFSQYPGGSVVEISLGGGLPAPPYAFSPMEVLAGFQAQLESSCGQGGMCWGGNLLNYAPGGGVENVGMTAAINAMLLGSVGGLKGYLQVFPFWPATEPANFTRLLGKGGFEVSASYSPTTKSLGGGGVAAAYVSSPVTIFSKYTLAGASATPVRLRSPWSTSAAGHIVTCAGVQVNFTWEPQTLTLKWAAPLGVPCEVSWS